MPDLSLPPTLKQVQEFALRKGIDDDTVNAWVYFAKKNNWRDLRGKLIRNWQVALKLFAKKINKEVPNA